MKTRYKIIIIITIGLTFILISIIFPQIFLIFHLDKYETSEKCNAIHGTWDWYYDTCSLGYQNPWEEIQCKDIGAISKCKPCRSELEYDPWHYSHPWGCLNMCKVVCEFVKIDEMGV